MKVSVYAINGSDNQLIPSFSMLANAIDYIGYDHPRELAEQYYHQQRINHQNPLAIMLCFGEEGDLIYRRGDLAK